MPKSQMYQPLRLAMIAIFLAMIAILMFAGVVQSLANDGIGPRFGLTVSSLPEDTPGVVVSDVRAGSVGEAGGLRVGDIIQEVNGKSVTNLADYEYAMREVDTMVMFLINRKGEHFYVALEGPAEPAR